MGEMLVIQRLHRDLENLREDAKVGTRDRLGPATVVNIGVQAIEILKCLHKCGILHRDMKPDNMMIGSENGQTIYLVDFGLAKQFMLDGCHVSPCKSNGLTGSARYCSMHVHGGRHSRRSDVES